jgi:hypothetical protein
VKRIDVITIHLLQSRSWLWYAATQVDGRIRTNICSEFAGKHDPSLQESGNDVMNASML